MSKHKHPVYGDVSVISDTTLTRARPALAASQRRWDIESYERYREGLIGGQVALCPSIFTFVRRRRTIEECTLLVSSFTAGSDLWLPSVDGLLADLAKVGIVAKYHESILRDASDDEVVANAHAEAQRLRQRLGLPV